MITGIPTQGYDGDGNTIRLRPAPAFGADDGSGGGDGGGSTPPCLGTGLFLALYRDGTAECLEVPTTGSFMITFEEGVAQALSVPTTGEYVVTCTDGVFAAEEIVACI